MKVCILLSGNRVGGGTRVPSVVASHLAESHEVTLMYPAVPLYTQEHVLKKTRWWSKLRFIGSGLRRYRPTFVFAEELDRRIRVEKYLIRPSGRRLRDFDAVVYLAPGQYHELKDLELPGVRKIFWSVADYFFDAGIGDSLAPVLQAYLSDDVLVAPSHRGHADLERYGFSPRAIIQGGIDEAFDSDGRSWNVEAPSVLAYYQPAWWIKGGATLIQALRWLRVAHPEVRVELFGHQTSSVEASGSLICDRFHTGLTYQGVRDLYRSHDIFVFPTYNDGFQAPPLEAMACGCAVVTTNIGGTSEYAVHEHNALVCEPLDYEGMFRQIERLLKDPELRQRISANAARDARPWRLGHASVKFDALLRELAGETGKFPEKEKK